MPPKTRVPQLDLPKNLPSEGAIKSHGRSLVNYEADFWEFEYQSSNYLGGLTDAMLISRHSDIVKNLTYLASPDRDSIPIFSFLSSWYWYRKEHQTRFEMHLRGLAAPLCAGYKSELLQEDGPERPKHPNAGNVLYRYGNLNRLEQLRASGGLRMWHAEFYTRLEQDLARQDNEMVKDRFLNGSSAIITMPDGKQVKPIGDIRFSSSGHDYFLLCMSCDWDQKLLSDFGVEYCGVITGVDEFASRLGCAISTVMPNYLFHHNPVEYFDPYESVPGQYLSHAMSKDFKYAYQREYRFLMLNPDSSPSDREHVDLEIGPLDGFSVWGK